MEKHLPFLVDELHEMWLDTTKTSDDADNSSLMNDIYAWRTAGLPKGSDTIGRPLSVGSVLVRSWHRALAPAFAAPPDYQYCCKKGMSVARATTTWLALKPQAGSEHDLSQAFDRLDHSVARVSMLAQGTYSSIASLFIRGWKGPRYCVVAGAIAAPIYPTRSASRGCPRAPDALVSYIAPWRTDGANQFAWMGDKTISPSLPAGQATTRIQAAIAQTTAFDDDLCILANKGKRQEWSHDNDVTIEHLGLRLDPLHLDDTILPKRGWDHVAQLIHNLQKIPGSFQVRLRLAQGFSVPHHWSMSGGSR